MGEIGFSALRRGALFSCLFFFKKGFFLMRGRSGRLAAGNDGTWKVFSVSEGWHGLWDVGGCIDLIFFLYICKKYHGVLVSSRMVLGEIRGCCWYFVMY